MPYQILFNEKEGLVHIIYTGTSQIEDHYFALNSAIRLCREKKAKKLLVDLSDLEIGSLSTMDIFSFGKFVAEIKETLHIAHVFSAHSETRNNISFVSNVEANRGKQTGNFDKAEDAITWLRNIKLN